MKGFITRNIFLLAMISFFTDIASEILFPVMPLYLTSIGFGVLAFGVIEGIAESVSGIFKVYFGYLSDKYHTRNIFIRIGYSLSAIAKPLFVFTNSVGVVVGLRSLDRIGKGVRTAPRDAVLTSESIPENRGKVFGFHRGMDTLGATLGPIIALVYLYFNPGEYKSLFLWAFVPGVLAIAGTFLLRKNREKKFVATDVGSVEEATKDLVSEKPKISFKKFWMFTGGDYKKLVIGFAIIALINTSDMFLILRAHELGISDLHIIIGYILYNVVFTVMSIPAGYLADKIGFKKVYVMGLFVFTLVYAVLAYPISLSTFFIIFSVYGIFSAISQSSTTAWISLHIPKSYEATGIGLNLMTQSVAIFAGSILFAFVWDGFGAQIAFLSVAFVSLCMSLYFYFLNTDSCKTDADGGKLSKLGCIGQH